MYSLQQSFLSVRTSTSALEQQGRNVRCEKELTSGYRYLTYVQALHSPEQSFFCVTSGHKQKAATKGRISWGAPQYAHSGGGDLGQPNTRFLGPTQIHTRNGISIGSAVLAQLVSNRADPQIDHGTSKHRIFALRACNAA